MDKEKNKRKRNVIILVIVLFMFIAVGLSFAWFRFMKVSNYTNSLTTGAIEVRLDEYDGKYINLINTYPMTDATGSATKAYEFTLVNNSSMSLNYDVRLIKDSTVIEEDDCEDKQLDDSVIRYKLERMNNLIVVDTLGEKRDWILDTYHIGAYEQNHYKLRLWIAEGAGNEYQNKHFHGKIEVNVVENG